VLTCYQESLDPSPIRDDATEVSVEFNLGDDVEKQGHAITEERQIAEGQDQQYPEETDAQNGVEEHVRDQEEHPGNGNQNSQNFQSMDFNANAGFNPMMQMPNMQQAGFGNFAGVMGKLQHPTFAIQVANIAF